MKKKKSTKKALTRKLDKAFSELVRSAGVCARCKRHAGEVQLQCAHIFSRRYRSVRWDIDNALCLCASCHFFAHHNPMEFSAWAMTLIGNDGYLDLLAKAHRSVKRTYDEMLDLYDVIEASKNK